MQCAYSVPLCYPWAEIYLRIEIPQTLICHGLPSPRNITQHLAAFHSRTSSPVNLQKITRVTMHHYFSYPFLLAPFALSAVAQDLSQLPTCAVRCVESKGRGNAFKLTYAYSKHLHFLLSAPPAASLQTSLVFVKILYSSSLSLLLSRKIASRPTSSAGHLCCSYNLPLSFYRG